MQENILYLYVSKDRLPIVGASLQRKVASLEGVERADVTVISAVNQFMTVFRGLDEFGDNEDIAIYLDKDKTSAIEIAELFKKAPQKRALLLANIKYVEA